MTRLAIFGATVAATTIGDLLWLGIIAKSFYRNQMGGLFTDHVVWHAAIGFYLVHALGVTYFCTMPALHAQSLGRLVVSALLFGLVTYGTYDLTNWATLRGWPPLLVGVDMCWGMVISLAAGLVGYLVGLKLLS